MSHFQWQVEKIVSIQVNQQVLEAVCYGPPPDAAPVIVMLHEGLGCLALWREFPRQLSNATGYGVFVYSRAGYGASAPSVVPRPLDYMAREATEVLPKILDIINLQKGILLGHSDGASIAAIYLGSVPDHRIRGLILIAPHFFTEELQLQAIAEARESYQHGSLKSGLAKYHANADATFYGWNDAWLHPDFKAWNISDNIDDWRVPVLALQGVDDQYGSMAQIEVIQQRAYCPVEVKIIDDCQHSPQLQQADITLEVITKFISRLARAEPFIVACQISISQVSISQISISKSSHNCVLPLPDYKHVPGVNARPADGFLHSVTSQAPATTCDETSGENIVWHYGLKLFNHGFYWECHEVLEAIWLRTPPNSRERFLVQGIIHLANAALKEAMHRPNAVNRLVQLAIECFERASPESGDVLMGLELKALKVLAALPPLSGRQLEYAK